MEYSMTAASSCFLASGLALLLLFSSSSHLRRSWPSGRTQQEQELAPGTSTRSIQLDNCDGQRIYIYDLPGQFNQQLLERCNSGIVPWLNFCDHISNNGFGQPLSPNFDALLGKGWYRTDSYMLEVIFHKRLTTYKCLTNDPARANAFYIPYYAGLDALHYLYNPGSNKSSHGTEVADWLSSNAAGNWQRKGGGDHFMVMGRTAWDFGAAGRDGDNSAWGTSILSSPKFSAMTLLFLERNPWSSSRSSSNQRQRAVPYPTSFHPSSRHELDDWIARVRSSARRYLFAFAGAMRPSQDDSIRSALLQQCLADGRRCKFVDCSDERLRCGHDPVPIATAFLSSDFCLQPRGDSATRRSAFDAIVAGCIPVFFREDSAYEQYKWHLPGEPRRYSVFVSEAEIRGGDASIDRILGEFSRGKVAEMRERLVEMVPRVIYSGGGGTGKRDAFDVAVEGVLEEVATG